MKKSSRNTHNENKKLKKSSNRSKYKEQIREKDAKIKELNESLIKAKDEFNSFN